MRTIIVAGMPRSGTSWLGQIFDSCPSVSFRMEPLFAYRFKNVIDQSASDGEIRDFLARLVDTDDEFINQTANRKAGAYPTFEKTAPDTLVLKTTRHPYLLERYLRIGPDVAVVGIVRHPCAAINSWIRSNREFAAKGCTVAADWRNGACRKTAPEEYWGFDDWLELAARYLELDGRYGNFHLIRYSDLVQDTETIVGRLFADLALPYSEQTARFLLDCHARHDENPYAVYKSKSVLDKWKHELPPDIAAEIIRDTEARGMQRFLA